MQTAPFKHVPNRQGVQLAVKAREFSISREDFKNFLDDQEKVESFFNLLNNGNWLKKLETSAAEIGGRIYVIKNLVVDYSQSHNDAATAGGPQTSSDYNVLKIGDLYQPGNKKITETIVLFNWPKGGGSYQKAVEWGTVNSFNKTTPHVPFAVGEKFSDLNYTLGPNPMYVVETTGCSFIGLAGACCVCWDDTKRDSGLDWQGNFGGCSGWFAFRKPN